MIRSHQNDTSNFSPALIQLHVERRPLTGLQFDVQRKIKLILGASHFRPCDFSVVTFTPRNYASKSNFRKRCCLCYGNEIGPGQKMKKKHEQLTKSVSNIWLFHVFAALLNSILLNLFRAIDSSTAGFQKPIKSTVYNSKTT